MPAALEDGIAARKFSLSGDPNEYVPLTERNGAATEKELESTATVDTVQVKIHFRSKNSRERKTSRQKLFLKLFHIPECFQKTFSPKKIFKEIFFQRNFFSKKFFFQRKFFSKKFFFKKIFFQGIFFQKDFFS